MAQGARPDPAVTRAREEKAWELVAQGFSQRGIAAQLEITQQAVSAMLERISRRVLATLEKRVKQEKARQSATLDYILAEALSAWRDSNEAFKASTKKTRK